MTIHSMGDSHAWLSFDGVPEIQTHHLGAITMRRIGRPQENLLMEEAEKIVRTSEEVLILSFGEIDIRSIVHPKQHEYPSIHGLFGEWTRDYLNKATALKGRIAIMSIPPPAEGAKLRNDQFPVRGTDAERAEWTRIANSMLATGTKKYNLEYFNVYEYFADDSGMLPSELSDSQVHLCCPSLVRQALIDGGFLEDG